MVFLVLISPEDHYRLHESTPTTAKDVRAFIEEVKSAAEEANADVYWRGQADHTWGLTSSLSRMARSLALVTDDDMREAESSLIQAAKSWITAPLAKPRNDLQWLAMLQHHWIPTRMIDFTPDPLVAAFFACESLPQVDGRLFAMLIPKSEPRITSAEANTFQIDSVPTGKVRLWQPPASISPRLRAQRGVFALGRLPSTAPARHVWDEHSNQKRFMVRSEVVSVMSISLYIVKIGTRRLATGQGTTCYTARLHLDKASVLEQLAKRSSHGGLRPAGPAIDHAYCYPDVEGMRRYSRVVERIQRGIN